MSTFDEQVQDHQSEWRKANIATVECGGRGKGRHPWILPVENWEDGLWQGIRGGSGNSLPDYLNQTAVRRHGGSNNLKSSWVLCANLYFPFGASEDGKSLLAGFLNAQVDQRIQCMDRVELEYAEHSFYPCSARIATGEKKKKKRLVNPDPKRCDHAIAVLNDPKGQCHQVAWGRKYWDHLASISEREKLAQLKCCPAARGGYQLFRQQALAEALANSKAYEFVVSCVMMDERNDILVDCLAATGIPTIGEWADLFSGRARFVVTNHRKWVTWVRERHAGGRWGEWLDYVERRYDYAL
jgi:hypothetical protein